ncbi:MAG TPA: TolC family protein [Verrucomicrobiae bacterium]|nr:TolC family protein [Verrucomicrobiae bacterium]
MSIRIPRPLLSTLCALATLLPGIALHAQTTTMPATNDFPGWLTQPLSLADAINMALKQNSTVLKSRQDLEVAHGIVVQTRAIVLPKLTATGNYEFNDAIETATVGPNTFSFQKDQNWNAGLRVVQSIYEGGRIASALRTAGLTRDQALFQHQAVIADTLLAVRKAYYDTLLAEQQIHVREASVELLQKELEDTTRRYEAGTVPRFNVLRAEVEVANAKPRLSRARNDWRIAKNNLANLLGFNLPANVWEDIPLQLTDRLEVEPYHIELPAAIAQALARRPELNALRKGEALAKESVTTAKSGYKPSVQLYGGYGWRNSSFVDDLATDVRGWNAGAQLSWNIFDGRQTQGKVTEARARLEQSHLQLDDSSRQIELEVRTAYSTFIEAREVLDATQKVVEQGDEALRLAKSRYDAGTGTQLDVLNAETSLTEARTTKNEALHDYLVARASLERAIGQDVPDPAAPRVK